MKGGAADFLTKPLDYERLREVLDELPAGVGADERASPASRSTTSSESPETPRLLGQSAAMEQIRRLVQEVASTDVPVFITGESGTGKEVVARTLHEASGRAGGEFVAINCAAIPSELMESELFGHEKGAFTGAVTSRPGCFELAHGGTLLLDEIAEMPEVLQPKLLRVLEDGRVRRLGGREEKELDVRSVAATNRDPEEAIADGKLRQDLFYRLNVVQVEIPPLRARREDIDLLLDHFLDRFNGRHGLAVEGFQAAARALLDDYSWPGNVRELRNVVERGVVLAKEGEIGPEHLPLSVRQPEAGSAREDVIELPVGVSVAEAERRSSSSARWS